MMPGQCLLLGGRSARSASTTQRGMMALDEVVRAALPDEARMGGHELLIGEDDDLLGLFVHRHFFPEETLWDRVAIGVQMHVPLGIHNPIVDSWSPWGYGVARSAGTVFP